MQVNLHPDAANDRQLCSANHAAAWRGRRSDGRDKTAANPLPGDASDGGRLSGRNSTELDGAELAQAPRPILIGTGRNVPPFAAGKNLPDERDVVARGRRQIDGQAEIADGGRSEKPALSQLKAMRHRPVAAEHEQTQVFRVKNFAAVVGEGVLVRIARQRVSQLRGGREYFAFRLPRRESFR